MAGGRPTNYNIELAKLICRRIATHDIGIARLCDMYDDMPCKTTLYEWRYDHPEFDKMYFESKTKQAHLMAESIDDIAHEREFFYDEKGNKRVDPNFTNDKRLRIDTRKWTAMKLLPKAYGERQQVETTIKHEDNIVDLG